MSALPSWVTRHADEVRECEQVCDRLIQRASNQRDLGVVSALVWLTLGEVAPMTWRSGEPTREVARAESWLALTVAAGQDGPTALDWRRLGTAPLPPRVADRKFAYGAWRTLAWLLGVQEDWPTHTGRHQAAGLPSPRPHLDLPRGSWGGPAWQLAEQASRERAEADALRHWRHVRERADATADR